MTPRLDARQAMGEAVESSNPGGGGAGRVDVVHGPRIVRSSKLPHVVRALRHENYRLFFGGQLISLIGTWMQSVAQSWLVYRLTGSAVLLGFVGFASQIPVLLLSPIGGAIADRYNRHRVLVATQTTSMLLAFILATLTLTGHVHVWHIFILTAMLGTVNAVDIPTRQAFAVDMVGREDLINAIALNSSMINGARIVGPAVAGILVASVGEGWCFLVNAISYLAVIAGLLMMTMKAQVRVAMPGSALAGILEGFRYVRSAKPIRSLLLLLGLISLTGIPYAVLMPIFADQVLHGGPRGLGLLMGASGFGALIGALVLAARKGIRGLGNWIALSAGGFGLSLILFSLSRSFWLSVVLIVPAGFTVMIEMAASNTLIQSLIPDSLRGRVMSVYSMMFIGMAPFGSLLAGAIAHHVGAPATVMLGGMVCTVGAVVFGWHLPALRHEARQMAAALRPVPGDLPPDLTGPASVVSPQGS